MGHLEERKLLLLTAVVLAYSAVLYDMGMCDHCYCVIPDSTNVSTNPLSIECGVCHHLSDIVNNKSFVSNDSIFYFLPGCYTLDEVWRISNASNLSLFGCTNDSCSTSENPLAVTLSCNNSCDNSGISFKNVSSLNITGMTFFGFGFNATFRNGTILARSALLMKCVWNLSMNHVKIKNTTGCGLYGHSILGHSIINNTIITEGHHYHNISGGNLHLKYYLSRSDANIFIINSYIENGTEYPKNTYYAGGVDIYFNTNRSIKVYFENVVIRNNSGFDGGNVAITYENLFDCWSSSVTFENCHIEYGHSKSNGGGIYMEMILHYYNSSHNWICPNASNTSNSVLNVTGTHFINNSAGKEGAGVYLEVHENENLTKTANVSFYNCKFRDNVSQRLNRGQGGTAVHVSNYRLPGSVPHHLPQFNITFHATNFTHNYVDVHVEDSLGCGTLYVSSNALTVVKNSRFMHNTCSGIAAVQSSIVMQGIITIENNTAFNGGGIVLCANSIMFLSYPVNVTIHKNHAVNFGGGIYAEFECSQAIPPCFFGSDENISSVVLSNNTASKSGSAVYGGSIDYCFTSGRSILIHNKHLKFDDLFNYTVSDHSKNYSVIASDPYEVCFCPQRGKGCTYNHTNSTTVYPGQTIIVKVVLIGQRYGTAPGVVLASTNNSNFSIDDLQKSQATSTGQQTCSKLKYTIYSSQKHFNPIALKIKLSVENAEYRAVTANTYHQPYIVLTNVTQCPLGFGMTVYQDGSTNFSVCGCSEDVIYHLNKVPCEISNTSIERRFDASWWLGVHYGSLNVSLIYGPYCPFDFCVRKTVYIDTTNNSSFNGQCAFHRIGVLCGKCEGNKSIVLGSSLCKDCHHSSISVIGYTLLFAVLGILLVVFLGVLNLNVAEGTLNAIIFYMNIVRVNSSLFFGSIDDKFSVLQFLRVFVAWMNLDLAIETCYIKQMSALQKVALQFVFPLYLWVLTACIIYFSRRYSLIAKITGKNSVKLLATIILLSYAKITVTIIDILWPTPIYSGEGFKKESRVWKMDGHVKYLEDYHRLLFAFAVVVAICTLPYTLSLLFIQCLNKWSNLKILYWVVKLKPFFDAHTGPYKDRYHFWTGFLLVVRISLFIAIVSNTTHGPILNLTLITVSVAVLIFINQAGVYRLWQLSVIESFAYLNLMVLSIGTAYVIFTQSNKRCTRTVILVLCVGSMFLLFCGIVVYNVSKMISLPQRWGVIRVWLLEKDWPWVKRKQIRSLLIQGSNVDSSSSSDEEMDPILHNAPPVARFHEYREPLIETFSNS